MLKDIFGSSDDVARLTTAFDNSRPLHLPGDPIGGKPNIFSLADLDALLTNGALTYPALQLAKDGAYLDSAQFAVNIDYSIGVMKGVIDPDQVRNFFNDGYTIVVNSLQRFHAPLRRLLRALENRFGCNVSANAYITPPCAKGFGAHFDTHDVLVFQAAGKKKWTIGRYAEQDPNDGEGEEGRIGEALMTIDLNQGGILYLPRGYLHSAETNDALSAHVTFGLHRLTWFDVIKSAVNKAGTIQGIRAPVPVDLIRGAHSPMHDAFYAGLLKQVAEKADLRESISLAVERFSDAAFLTKEFSGLLDRKSEESK